MSNQVDVSPETIDREWQRIAGEHQVMKPTTVEPGEELPPIDADNSGLDFEGVDGALLLTGPEQTEHAPEDTSFEDRVVAAEMVINGALVFVFDAMGGLDISNDKYVKMSRAWAVVIAKRFEGGIFEFMAKYKDELTAVGASFVFVGAVREGLKVKREKSEVARTEKAAKVQDSAEAVDHGQH